MLKDFCMTLLSGVIVCFSGAFLLDLLASFLSHYVDGRILYSDPVVVLMMSLPALFWGLWLGRPIARPRIKVARITLIFIGIVTTAIVDTNNFGLMLMVSLSVWSFGMLGLFLGSKLPS